MGQVGRDAVCSMGPNKTKAAIRRRAGKEREREGKKKASGGEAFCSVGWRGEQSH